MILLGGGLMYDLAGENGLDLDALRARLQRMSDRDLLRFGRAAQYMCSPAANLGNEPRQVLSPQEMEPPDLRRISTTDKHVTVSITHLRPVEIAS